MVQLGHCGKPNAQLISAYGSDVIARGKQAAEEGRYKDALDLYAAAMYYTPKATKLLKYRAEALMALDELELAMLDATAWYECELRKVETVDLLRRVCLAKKDFASAIEWAKVACNAGESSGAHSERIKWQKVYEETMEEYKAFAEGSTDAGIKKLPKDLFLHIMGYFEHSIDLHHCSQVDFKWRDMLIKSPSVWRDLRVGESRRSGSIFNTLIKRLSPPDSPHRAKLRTLWLDDLSQLPTGKIVDTVVRLAQQGDFSQLRTLIIDGAELYARSNRPCGAMDIVLAIVESPHQLRTMVLDFGRYNGALSALSFASLAKSCPDLVSFDISISNYHKARVDRAQRALQVAAEHPPNGPMDVDGPDLEHLRHFIMSSSTTDEGQAHSFPFSTMTLPVPIRLVSLGTHGKNDKMAEAIKLALMNGGTLEEWDVTSDTLTPTESTRPQLPTSTATSVIFDKLHTLVISGSYAARCVLSIVESAPLVRKLSLTAVHYRSSSGPILGALVVPLGNLETLELNSSDIEEPDFKDGLIHWYHLTTLRLSMTVPYGGEYEKITDRQVSYLMDERVAPRLSHLDLTGAKLFGATLNKMLNKRNGPAKALRDRTAENPVPIERITVVQTNGVAEKSALALRAQVAKVVFNWSEHGLEQIRQEEAGEKVTPWPSRKRGADRDPEGSRGGQRLRM